MSRMRPGRGGISPVSHWVKSLLITSQGLEAISGQQRAGADLCKWRMGCQW